jgi:hypothetical protein
MKAVSIKELKQELDNVPPKELRELCLRLSRFKMENKELLTYLLFESSDEAAYVESVKNEIDLQFDQVNRKSYYLIKKSIRKILLNSRKYIRYSRNKKTEVDILIHFCTKLNKFSPSIQKNSGLRNLYIRQIDNIIQKVSSLHEDLQYDYGTELNALKIY